MDRTRIPRIKILFIDSDYLFLCAAKKFLENNYDFFVDTSISSTLALFLIEHEHYDVIISDYSLPAVNGIEVLKRSRGLGIMTPFIFLTGDARAEIAIEAINNGVNAYLQKGGEPIDQFAELANMIQIVYYRHKVQSIPDENESRFKRVFEQSAEPQILLDIDGHFKDCNMAFLNLIQITDRHLILGHNFMEFSPENQRDGTLSAERKETLLKKVMKARSIHCQWLQYKNAFERIPHLHDLTLTCISLVDRKIIHVSIRKVRVWKRDKSGMPVQ